MSTWAQVAASGPPQSKEEGRDRGVTVVLMVTDADRISRANSVDEVIPIESSIGSLVDVDSGVSVVDSGFPEKEIKTETQARRIALEGTAAEAAEEEGKEGKKAQKKPQKKPTSSTASIYAQFQNPIALTNAITTAAISALLGFVGFRKHQAGQLNLKAVGLGVAFAAAFGTADYYISSYLFKKYPPKK